MPWWGWLLGISVLANIVCVPWVAHDVRNLWRLSAPTD
jgi:hypothetical protein